MSDKQNEKIENNNQYFMKMFRFMKPYAFPYAAGLILSSTQMFALSFIIATLTSNLVAAITAGSLDAIVNAGIVLAVMFLAYVVIISVGLPLFYMSVAKAVKDLKRQLFRAFIRGSLEDAGHSGEGIASINTDADIASQILSNVIRQFVTPIVSIILSLAVIFVVDWRLGFAILAVGLAGFFVQNRFAKPIGKISKARLEANADSIKAAGNVYAGAVTIRAFNMQSRVVETFDRENQRIKVLDFKRGFVAMWQNSYFYVQLWMTLVVVFAFGGWLVITGRLELHMLMMVPALSTTLTGAFGSIGNAYANFQGPLAGARRVFDRLEQESEVRIQKSGFREPEGYGLHIRDFSFTYRGAEEAVLSGIDLDIDENEMVAFVGASGSGKSTLLRAVIGFYERDEIGISLGGLGFNESSAANWRQNFAYVDQSCKLFDMSVKENISMGKLGKASDDEIVAAAKRAAAHDFIIALEGGYDAPCGEKGGTLSGGQKQRVAIARALVKGAPILVFDEATSSLDKDSERSVMETIESLRDDHTILITSHNLETIVNADKIVVLEQGRIVEIGRHEDLMAKKGVYHGLYTQEN